jgi:predicted metal-binding transcription factor (methanogenesis marker protein 9)
MNMKQVKEKAKTLGLQPGRMKKAELIRAIQTAEGNSPCFETAQGDCSQTGCCWMGDCVARTLDLS